MAKAHRQRPYQPTSPPHSDKKQRPRDEAPERRKKKRKLDRSEHSNGNVRPKGNRGDGSDAASTPTAVPHDASDWSKSKKKRMRALKAKMNRQLHAGGGSDASGGTRLKGAAPHEKEGPAPRSKTTEKSMDDKRSDINEPLVSDNKPMMKPMSALAKSYEARLQGSKFRFLNEQLYTMHSRDAFAHFSSQPHLFHDYHAGFASQVEHWPVQPVTVVAKELTRLIAAERNGTSRPSKGDKKAQTHLVIADFGCGDAQLARDLLKVKDATGNCPFTVHSFDLVASSDLVTACDMSHTPLPGGSVDVAVFCLSLMGNNLADFIREAHRVLKARGSVKIVEVRSRFETTIADDTKVSHDHGDKQKRGKNQNDLKPVSELKRFVSALEKLGFDCIRLDQSNKMFLIMDLRKNGRVPDKMLDFTAKPCVYKRR